MGETKRHLETRTALYKILQAALDADAVGSEQFVYFNAADPGQCFSPDVFVKRGVVLRDFDIWKTWERGAPELVVEIMSTSDRREMTWEEKMARYHAAGVAEVVRFDPQNHDHPIRVWDRVEEDLVERDEDSPDLDVCQTLGLYWVVVPSEFGPMLRPSRDREGTDLLPTVDEALEIEAEARQREAEARAAAERERAAAERERDAALAELARLRAERSR